MTMGDSEAGAALRKCYAVQVPGTSTAALQAQLSILSNYVVQDTAVSGWGCLSMLSRRYRRPLFYEASLHYAVGATYMEGFNIVASVMRSPTR
jgi:hypothetical protein